MKRLLYILIISVFHIPIYAQDIAQWRGPNRNGVYNEKGLLRKWPETGPELLWHFDDLGVGFTSAAVTSSGVFVTGMIDATGYVFAFNNNGKLLWKKDYGKEWASNWDGTRSTPLILKDKLFVLSSYGKLVCMNVSTGAVIWSTELLKEYDGRNIIWGITENLLFDGSTLFCCPGGVDANVIALDVNTGKLIWKSSGNKEKSAHGSPLLISLASRKIIVAMMENSIQAIDASNGKFLWKHTQPEEYLKQPKSNEYSIHPNIPVFIDGNLFCTSGWGQGGVMLKLSADGSRVTELWKNKSLDPKIGGVVVLDSKIFGSSDRPRRLLCLDWNSGKELYSIKQLAPSNIIANDGLLYVYSEQGIVALVEPKADSFNIISSFEVPYGTANHWAHLVINKKRMYVRHGNSLMVYNIASN